MTFVAETDWNWGLVILVFNNCTFDDYVKEYTAACVKVSLPAVMLSKNLLYKMDGTNFGATMESGFAINTLARMTEDCQNGIARFLKK